MAVKKKAVLMESSAVANSVKIGQKDFDKLDQICRLAKEIGLVTVQDVMTFLNNEANPGDTVYSALKRYRDLLGDDFQIQVEESYKRLAEDKGYIARDEAEDDVLRLVHYLSVSGYSETRDADKEIAATAAAAGKKVRTQNLGYIAADEYKPSWSDKKEYYVTVHAETPGNLDKAKKVADDFGCIIDAEEEVTLRNGKKEYVIYIDPYSGYEYGSLECAVAMDNYTSQGQLDAYATKRKERAKVAAAVAAAQEEDDDEDYDLDEACDKKKDEDLVITIGDDDCDGETVCDICGKVIEPGCGKNEIDLGRMCPECVAKRMQLGESLTFVRKLKKKN